MNFITCMHFIVHIFLVTEKIFFSRKIYRNPMFTYQKIVNLENSKKLIRIGKFLSKVHVLDVVKNPPDQITENCLGEFACVMLVSVFVFSFISFVVSLPPAIQPVFCIISYCIPHFILLYAKVKK